MTFPRIQAIGRALPERAYTQEQLWEYSPFEGQHPLFDRLFLDSEIESRRLFVPPAFYDAPRTLTETNEAWRQGALSLGRAALEHALELAAWDPASIQHFGVTTVTGYTTPGLDLLLAQRCGLPATVARTHLNCIGCHAAIPLLRTVTEHVRAHPTHRAVALAVEICSSCLRQDGDPQNLVALSLFGDGAAALAISMDGDGPQIVGFESAFAFDHLDALGFELTTTGFRIVLDPAIPSIIAQHIGTATQRLFDAHDIDRDEVSVWAFHPGGSRILDAVQAELGLDDGNMAYSRDVLAQCGNMSSPSVLFVLAEALAQGAAQPGSYGVMAAFGPGLGIELCLLKFDSGS